jgi:hypothetical protein
MASSFQSGAFQVAAFQLDGVVPPVVVVPRRFGGLTPEAARQADKNREAFDRSQSERRRQLRESIERAFAPVRVVSSVPVPEARRAAIVETVRSEINTAGLAASLAEIERMFDAYQRRRIAEWEAQVERQLEEEAIVLLLAS